MTGEQSDIFSHIRSFLVFLFLPNSLSLIFANNTVGISCVLRELSHFVLYKTLLHQPCLCQYCHAHQ